MGVIQGGMGFMSTMETQMDKSSEHEWETGAIDGLLVFGIPTVDAKNPAFSVMQGS